MVDGHIRTSVLQEEMMDAKEFERKVGREPALWELEQINCKLAGLIDHPLCGWCKVHDMPRFQCGCHVEVWDGGKVK